MNFFGREDWYPTLPSFLEKKMKNYIYITILGLLIACTTNTKPADDDLKAALVLLDEDIFGSVKIDPNSFDAKTVVTKQDGASFITEVNASSTRRRIYVDLNQDGIAAPESGNWDLHFKRFVIGTNSGTSGSGSGGSCSTGSVNFAAITNATTCINQIDSIQTQNGEGFGDVNDSASPPMFLWYDYDIDNHSITAKNTVYIIQSYNGYNRFKIQMLDYYSQSGGAPGYPRFRWAKLN